MPRIIPWITLNEPLAGTYLVTLGINEAESYVTGTTESTLTNADKSLDFVKDYKTCNLVKLRVLGQIKVTGGTGTISFYIDGETSPRLTWTTTSTSYEIVNGVIEIRDLGEGLHTLYVKAKNSTTETTYLRFYHCIGVIE